MANAAAGAVAGLTHQGGGLFMLAMRELEELDRRSVSFPVKDTRRY